MPKRKMAAVDGDPAEHVLSSKYGENMTNGILKSEHKPSAPRGKGTTDDELQLVLQSFRLLVADLCEQFNM